MQMTANGSTTKLIEIMSLKIAELTEPVNVAHGLVWTKMIGRCVILGGAGNTVTR